MLWLELFDVAIVRTAHGVGYADFVTPFCETVNLLENKALPGFPVSEKVAV
jgi:hypothetical protein